MLAVLVLAALLVMALAGCGGGSGTDGGGGSALIGQEISARGALWGDLTWKEEGEIFRTEWSDEWRLQTTTTPKMLHLITGGETPWGLYINEEVPNMEWPLGVACGRGVVAALLSGEVRVATWNEVDATWNKFKRICDNDTGLTAISFGNSPPGEAPTGRLLVGGKMVGDKVVVTKVIKTF